MLHLLLALIISCTFALVSKAQANLVPNSSFENTVQCPFSLGMQEYVADWYYARFSPDYYNACATSWVAGIPLNQFGYQKAFDGNAYIGMFTYRANSVTESEVTGVLLKQPLEIGTKYYVSFRTVLTLSATGASTFTANNKIGIQFSTTEYSKSSPAPINNSCHVCTNDIITDSVNWTMVRGAFVADSAYTHLNIGNFYDKLSVDTVCFDCPEWNGYGSYYYFDDVRVSTDSNYAFQVVGINSPSRDKLTFIVYPNPAADYFIVENGIANKPYDLAIFNTTGQLLFHESGITDNYKSINCKHYDTNFLLIKISTNNQTFFSKILK